MFCGIPAQVADSDCQTIPHTQDTELGDRVLFKEFHDELLRISNHKEVARRPEVLLSHGLREIQE